MQCLRPSLLPADRIHGEPKGQIQGRLLLWKFSVLRGTANPDHLILQQGGVSDPTTGMETWAYCMYRAQSERIREDCFLQERHWRRQDNLKMVCLHLLFQGCMVPCWSWLASGQRLAPLVSSRSCFLCALALPLLYYGSSLKMPFFFFFLNFP